MVEAKTKVAPDPDPFVSFENSWPPLPLGLPLIDLRIPTHRFFNALGDSPAAGGSLVPMSGKLAGKSLKKASHHVYLSGSSTTLFLSLWRFLSLSWEEHGVRSTLKGSASYRILKVA